MKLTELQETNLYIEANKHVNGGEKVPKDIKGSDRMKVVDLVFESFIEGAKNQMEATPFSSGDLFLFCGYYVGRMFEEKDIEKIFNEWLEIVGRK
jgi:hypothetical protein